MHGGCLSTDLVETLLAAATGPESLSAKPARDRLDTNSGDLTFEPALERLVGGQVRYRGRGSEATRSTAVGCSQVSGRACKMSELNAPTIARIASG